MIHFSALNELLSHDAQSKALFDTLPREQQVELKEQRQDICTREDFASTVHGLQKRKQ